MTITTETKRKVLAIIDARIGLYEAKAKKRDPLASNDRNAHEAAIDNAEAIRWLRFEMLHMFATEAE